MCCSRGFLSLRRLEQILPHEKNLVAEVGVHLQALEELCLPNAWPPPHLHERLSLHIWMAKKHCFPHPSSPIVRPHDLNLEILTVSQKLRVRSGGMFNLGAEGSCKFFHSAGSTNRNKMF